MNDGWDVMGDRVLHATKIYKHDDRELIPVLMSAIIKGYYGQHGTVAVIDRARPFISVSSKSWTWSKLPRGFSTSLPLRLGIYSESVASDFFVLRYFSPGGDGRVFLGLCPQTRLLCVAKIYKKESPELADIEMDLWLKLWGVSTRKCFLVGNVSLLMPLVFTAKSDRSFAILPKDWAYNRGSLPAENETAFVDLTNQALACFHARVWTFEEAYNEASSVLTRFGYRHGDMKTEHVALLPVLDIFGKIISLRPIFIDLTTVTVAEK
jgi:hypothetical protein